MKTTKLVPLVALAAGLMAAGVSAPAQAQFDDPEGGYTEPEEQQPPEGGAEGSWQGGGQATTGGQATAGGTASGGTSGTRLGIQGRLSALNLAFNNPLVLGLSVAPIATPGVRLLDGDLFFGVGLGFASINDDGGTAFSMSPTVNYDLLADELGALYFAGWLNLGHIDDAPPDTFFFGMNFGLGVRGHITEGLAIGSEWGWGFAYLTDPDAQNFINGFFGTLMFEASIGI